jgi:hypothetical protein
MHFLNISCDPSVLLPTFHSKIITFPHLFRPELGSWCQLGEEIAGIGPIYKGWIKGSGNTAVTGKMCVRWH